MHFFCSGVWAVPFFKAPEATNPLTANGVFFVPNNGQIADLKGKSRPDILYSAELNHGKVYLTKTGLSFVMVDWAQKETLLSTAGLKFKSKYDELKAIEKLGEKANLSGCRVDVEFVNANSGVTPVEEDILPGYLNFYYSHCPNGVTGVQRCKKVTYPNLYPNIDLVYQAGGNKSTLKYDFVVKPGGNVNSIVIKYKGSENVFSDGQRIRIITKLGEINEWMPSVFQNKNGSKVYIDAKYRLKKIAADVFQVVFDIGDYDKSLPLVIDPWMSYYGGSGNEYGVSVTNDLSENLIFSGIVASVNFPVSSGAFQVNLLGINDAFVVSMNASGTVLNFATYYGGTAVEYGFGVCTDPSNNIIFCGEVSSSNFPVGAQPGYVVNQSFMLLAQDGFVVKLNSSGVRLFGTYCGGNVTDNLRDICTDAQGNIITIGLTSSTGGISTPGVFQTTLGGGADMFVTKFLPTGALAWGTYCGGSLDEWGYGIACDKSNGSVYVTGITSSSNFPTSGGFQMNSGGADDAVLVKLSSSGTGIWSTYYGGTSIDVGSAVEVDGNGNVILGGSSLGPSPVGVISTPGSYQPTFSGVEDAFVVKFNSAGTRLWGSYLGGSVSTTLANDNLTGIGVDPLNNIVVGGNTFCQDFPTTVCAYQPNFSGNHCLYIASFSPSGNVICSSYLGMNNTLGNEGMWGNGGGSIAVYGCHIYLSGYSFCNFPVTSGAYQTACGGSDEAVMAQLSISSCGLKMPFSVSVSTNPSGCLCNGSVTTSITPSCKIPPFSYFYSNATQTVSTLAISNSATNVCAGINSYTVATMCDTVVGNVFVQGTSSVSAVIHHANCFSSTGSVAINSVNNATPGFTVKEGNVVVLSNVTLPCIIPNLSVGSHSFVIYGANGCITTYSATILAPVPPAVNVVNPATIICSSPTINLNSATNATGTVTYTWTGPSFVSGQNTSSPVVNQVGNYNLNWTYGSCAGSNTLSVLTSTNPPTVTVTASGSITCSNPAVVLTATCDVANASYSWVPQNVTTNTSIAMSGGTYTVIVTDPSNSCSTTATLTVAQNTAAPTISATTNGSITCTQTMVVITGTSVTSGVTYSWSPTGATTNTISVTTVGIHTLTISDPVNGCSAVKTITVFPISAFVASVNTTYSVKCNSAATGSIQIDVTGGSGIYSLTIVNNTTSLGAFNSYTIPVTGLTAGTYTIFMRDTLSGCTNIVNVTIAEPTPIVLTTTVVSQFTVCEGDQVKILSSTSGGVAPYQYTWLPFGGNTPTLDVVAGPNSYTLQAVDANSCVVYSVKTVTVYPKPQTALLNTPIVLCGSVCVTFTLAAAQNTTFVYNWTFTDASGGVAPIQVSQYNPSICFTQPGMYGVDISVYSAFGCSTQSVFPYFVQEYPVVKADYSFSQPDGAFIFNDVVFTNNSTGAMSYSWYNENDLFSIKHQPTYVFYEPGYYLVSLIASNPACADTMSRKIFVGEATFIHIPNSFTPNNDGLNEVWRPVFYGDFQGGDYELSVFNRWGQRVFWTLIIDRGWDGTFKERSCEEGVYTWEMKINANGVNTKKTGMITLIR